MMSCRTFTGYNVLCMVFVYCSIQLAFPVIGNNVSRATQTTGCDVVEQTGCLPGQCCIKQILINKKQTKQRVHEDMLCKPLKKSGELCIPRDIMYSCPCGNGLSCMQEDDEQHFGHCN